MAIMLKLKAKAGEQPRRGYDHYWSVIMDMSPAAFSVADIHQRSSSTTGAIRSYCERLAAAGLIEVAGETDKGKPTYVAKVRQDRAPRFRSDGTVSESATHQQAIWNALRSPVCRQGFTLDDVVAWASTDDTRLNRASVHRYVLMLKGAGYLVQLTTPRSNSPGLWRLIPDMNTGPLAPMVLQTTVVFDQNRHAVMGDAEATEVAS